MTMNRPPSLLIYFVKNRIYNQEKLSNREIFLTTDQHQKSTTTMDHPVLLSTVIILLGHLVFHLYYSYRRLKHIPGPLWAKLTNLERVWWVKTGRAHDIHQRLHEKYGTSVRFGPNMVSISDPEALPIIYPARMGFPKVNDS